MSFASWRGTVGLVKPTYRPGTLEEFIRLLPEGIAVIPLYVGFQAGTQAEFREALPAIEARVAELARIGVDLVVVEGAPPMMVHGFRRERELLEAWRARYGRPILSAGTMQTAALRALGIQRFVGVTYFPDDLNQLFAAYFRDAGFEVLAMDGLQVPFDQVGRLASREVYAHAKAAFLRHPDADGIYMLGSGWRALDVVELLEQDLQVPVALATPVEVWAVQQHLRVRQPVRGYGRLLAELPLTQG